MALSRFDVFRDFGESCIFMRGSLFYSVFLILSFYNILQFSVWLRYGCLTASLDLARSVKLMSMSLADVVATIQHGGPRLTAAIFFVALVLGIVVLHYVFRGLVHILSRYTKIPSISSGMSCASCRS